MKKYAIFALIMFAVLILSNYSFGADEEITLTTYYPAPYGDYTNLETENLTTDRVIFNAKAGDPANWDGAGSHTGAEGELVYSDTKDAFYHSNGSSWLASGGSGGSGGAAISLKCGWLENTLNIAPSIGSCVPDNCPTGWTQVGDVYCAPTGFAESGLPAGDVMGYCERWCVKN